MHRRHSIRLRGHDYTSPGAYFITICVQNRDCSLGKIQNKVMGLDAIGKLVKNQWEMLPRFFQHIELDVFQFMPNHMHGIIVIKNCPYSPVDNNNSAQHLLGSKSGSISESDRRRYGYAIDFSIAARPRAAFGSIKALTLGRKYGLFKVLFVWSRMACRPGESPGRR